ncbi:MAG TPA: hypothetical protein VHW67_01430 [Solirubrobacteraceae bacterium]|jgi:hypothetical protein|nr:hypothetical protein [Solirubrobacteraceae bacterium]
MRQTDRTRKSGHKRRARPTRYSSLQSFYTADSRRVHSRECDVGLWWREAADGPLHRAAWVSDTGELYLVRLGPPEQGGGQVEVLATIAEHERLERVLEGWRERCGEPRSLSWLRERSARIGSRVRATQAEIAGAVAGAGAMLTAGLSLAAELG